MFFKKKEHPLHKKFREEAFSPEKIRKDIVNCYNLLRVQTEAVKELHQRIRELEKKVDKYWRVP